MMALIWLLAAGIASRAAAQDTRSVQVFAAVPSQSSDAFKANLAGDFRIPPPHGWDTTPYHVQTPFRTVLNRKEGEKIILAGSPDGTAGWRIDNFVFIEITSGNTADRFYLGTVSSVEYRGRILRSMGGGFGQGPFDLTPFIPPGVPATITIYALDYGGIGYVSDLFIVTKSDGMPAEAVLSFYYRSGGSWLPTEPAGVPFGTPFLVEAAFERAPDEAPVVDLDWPGMTAPLSLALEPVAGSDVVFRSYWLVMSEAGQVTAYARP
ncbi:MAG: hypothetical protein V3R73_02895 [Sphingomonadales bacterium]